MPRTALASIVLTAIPVSSLAAPVAAYRLTLTETATGAVISTDGAVDATAITVPAVPAGTYAAAIVAVDAAGNALMPAVTAALPIVVADVAEVTVNVPAALSVSLG